MCRIFLKGEKVQVFHSVKVLGSQTGILKGPQKTPRNSRVEKGLTIFEFRGHGGEQFGISKSRGGG